MAEETTFLCGGCGTQHAGLPMSYGSDAPEYWSDSLDHDPRSLLQDDLCMIRAEHFFIRGRLLLPVLDDPDGQPFEWGVWVSLSRDNFERALSLWTTVGRESEPAYFGWLCTELPTYGRSTLSLKTHVHTQPVGLRALIMLEPSEHPLAVEQRVGVTKARVQEIAEALLHPPT